MSAMSELDAMLRDLGNVHIDEDGQGEPWLEFEPGRFRYVSFGAGGPRAIGKVYTRAEIESTRGPLVPLTY